MNVCSLYVCFLVRWHVAQLINGCYCKYLCRVLWYILGVGYSARIGIFLISLTFFPFRLFLVLQRLLCLFSLSCLRPFSASSHLWLCWSCTYLAFARDFFPLPPLGVSASPALRDRRRIPSAFGVVSVGLR